MVKIDCKKKLFLALSVLFFGSCNYDDYCQLSETKSEYAPVLDRLEELDPERQAALELVNTEGIDPWLVIAELDFIDDDGDLGNGEVSVSVNGKESYRLKLATIFGQYGLDRNATSGNLALPFRLIPNNTSKSGTAIMKIGVSLIDEAGHVSNCRGLNIQMTYTD